MKKFSICIICLLSAVAAGAKDYVPPQPDEVVFVSPERLEYISSCEYILWNDLIARKQDVNRVLISIPLGTNGGVQQDMTWSTDRYLYFYLLGNERLDNKKLRDFAEQNGIQEKTFGEIGGTGWDNQSEYVLSTGMTLFRFDLQTGEFSSTGFTLHNMEFAVSPDDTRICTKYRVPEETGGYSEKLAMYSLEDGSCISEDITESYPEIGTDGEFIFYGRSYCYGKSNDHFICSGDLQQTWPDLIWSCGYEYQLWWGKIDWNTCAVVPFSKGSMEPNYYVSDGPLNMRTDPGLNGRKMFFYQLPTGTKVFVTETGKTETIDGITAPWVWIWTEDTRFYGWVFSGYLKKTE